MFCDNCGSQLTSGDMFCANCGAPIECVEKTDVTPQPSAFDEGGTSAGFTPIVTNEAKKPMSPDAKKKIIIIASVVLALIVIVTVVVIVISNLGGSDDYSDSYTQIEETTNNNNIKDSDSTTSETQDDNSNLINTMTMDERKEINTFISNFAEVNFPDYNNEYYSAEDLINFSILHNYANDYGDILVKKGYAMVERKVVEDNLLRYFGVNDGLVETDICTVDDYVVMATVDSLRDKANIDNGAVYRVAFVDNMTDNGDGTYDIDFSIYSSENAISNDMYAYSQDDVINDSSLSHVSTGQAKVRGDGDYILTYYAVN